MTDKQMFWVTLLWGSMILFGIITYILETVSKGT